MDGLLVRVAADKTEIGGKWNGPVDSHSGAFVYVPIIEKKAVHPNLRTPFCELTPILDGCWPPMPPHLGEQLMHLDPDFKHLTYGDGNNRAIQIKEKLGPGDLLVFYSGLKDVHHSPRLMYAIIGLFVIKDIVHANEVPPERWGQNAHTRRKVVPPGDIVVRARPVVSGRLKTCLPIGDYRPPKDNPAKQPSYRLRYSLSRRWGGVTTDYLQRSAILPQLKDAKRFYDWFKSQDVELIRRNN